MNKVNIAASDTWIGKDDVKRIMHNYLEVEYESM